MLDEPDASDYKGLYRCRFSLGGMKFDLFAIKSEYLLSFEATTAAVTAVLNKMPHLKAATPRNKKYRVHLFRSVYETLNFIAALESAEPCAHKENNNAET